MRQDIRPTAVPTTKRTTAATVLTKALATAMLLCAAACTSDTETAVTPPDTPTAVTFSGTLSGIADNTRATLPDAGGSTRATYPDMSGTMKLAQLKNSGFAVFAQYTTDKRWDDYWKNHSTGVPFNFMWNQEVTCVDPSAEVPQWDYTPVKYWPNGNDPADDRGAGSQQSRSYLQFFGYAPYVTVADASAGFDVSAVDENSDGKPDHDGIVALTANGTEAKSSYLHYRTSQELPFSEEKSVDLLWATTRDRYKYDDDDSKDDGRVQDRVPLVFKHALSRLTVQVRALIDRSSTVTSPAYKDLIDGRSLLYIDRVDITTPPFYSEGHLLLAPEGDVPTWDFMGFGSYMKTGFQLNSKTDDAIDDVAYQLYWDGKPTDHDNADDAEADFEALKKARPGLTDAEPQQLAAKYRTYMFPPSTKNGDIQIRTIYYVETYDEKLTLNSPRYYSIVKNDITAKMGNSDFTFEPGKEYRLLLSLGLTSVKFDIYVLDDRGEWILLSAVVKEWDPETVEANVE